MTWRLSLDMGTNSLGWAALELEPNAEGKNQLHPVKLKDIGVRIFPDGREPAGEGRVGDPLNSARREARGLRRGRYRKNKRHNEVAQILENYHLIPKKGDVRKIFHQINPYEARALAARQAVDDAYIGRALLNLSFHRGFKSNRKDQNEKESSQRLKEIKQLRDQLQDQTLGEYLWNKSQDDYAPSLRFRGDKAIFPDRAMIEDEFQHIRQAQNHNDQLTPDFWDSIYDAIFFQRPLKAQERGLCTFLWHQNEPRALKAQPSSERFRIWSEINNLKWLDESRNAHKLSDEQREAVAQKLLTTISDVKFSTLLALKKAKQPLFPDAVSFNLATLHRNSMKAAPIFSKLSKLEAFNKLDTEQQDILVLKMNDEETEEKLRQYIGSLGFNDDEIENLLKLRLPSGTTNLSTKIMRATIPLLQETGQTYDEVIPLAGERLGINLHHSHLHNGDVVDKLPYYGAILRASVMGGSSEADPNKTPEAHYGRIANPTVHVALNQLQKLVNCLVKRFGLPSEIIVEVSRELKQTREARDRNMKIQKANQKINKELSDLFSELGYGEPKGQDYKKYKLWRELGENKVDRRCIFSGQNISAEMLFTGAVQIEHILPYGRTLDNSMNNLTLAVREANIFKKQNTPYEAFGQNQAAHFSRSGESDWSWGAISRRASDLSNENKKNRFAPDAMENFDADGDFLDRQLTDNAYLSRKSKEFLSHLIDPNKVWTIKGGLTEKIRGQWHLNGLLNDDGHRQKNRTDHRHHAIDAFVIGMTERSLIQKMAYQVKKHDDGKTTSPIPLLDDVLHNALVEKLEHMIISYKPDHGLNSKFFNETAYGLLSEDKRDAEYPEHNLVYRKTIENLTPKMVKYIRDVHIRQQVLDFIDQPQNSNKKLSDVLSEFSQQTGIKKLRILDKDATVKPSFSAPYKGYAPAGYAYVDIWQIPKKKGGKYVKNTYEYQGIFTSFNDAMTDNCHTKNKPHPAAKHIMRLFKDDMVELEGKIYKVFGFYTTTNRIDIGPQYLTQAKRKQSPQSINQLIPKGMKKLHIRIDGQRQ